MRSIPCGNALTFLFNIKNAWKWFTLKRFSKTFLVYDENGEENVHYFTTRHKHLSKREKNTSGFNNLKFQLFLALLTNSKLLC